MKTKTITLTFQCPDCGKIYSLNFATDKRGVGVGVPKTEFRQGKRLMVCTDCSDEGIQLGVC